MKYFFQDLQRRTSARSTARLLGRSLGAALLAALVGLAALTTGRTLLASDPNNASFGGTGGDSIGSLPLTAPGGGNNSIESPDPGIIGPARPSIALTGTEDHLLAVLLDAVPASVDAGYAVFALPDGRYRLEFYGQLDLVLDRSRLVSTPVTAQIRVGSTFQGGVASLSVAGEVRAVQALPLGQLPFPIQQLSNSGVLNQGLVWRAVSLGGSQRKLDVRQTGAVIRIEQRD
jgi:hypothetical protein